MSLKQCPGCGEMVDDSKAYCPDCGTPMDEEQRRNGASEYDSLMKTQNINLTSQLKLIEDFNLSSVFTPPKPTDEQSAANKESAIARGESKTIQLQAIPEAFTANRQPESVVSQTEKPNASDSNTSGEATPDSKKTLYIVGGVVLFLIGLALAAAFTFGILYWFNPK